MKVNGMNFIGGYLIFIFVNNIFYFLFSEIDVSFNGKVIILGMDIYFYKVYLEKLLFYVFKILEIQMRVCSLWEKDMVGYMDEVKLEVLV